MNRLDKPEIDFFSHLQFNMQGGFFKAVEKDSGIFIEYQIEKNQWINFHFPNLEKSVNILQYIHPEDLISFYESMETSNINSVEWTWEGRVLNEHSRILWVYWKFIASTEKNIWIGSIYDTTNLSMQRINKEVVFQKFRKMADFAPVLIWTSDITTKCNYFNKVWLDFTGRTIEEELGDGWVEGVHPEDLESCVNTYLVSFHNKVPFRMEYRLKRYDGQFRWILDTGVPYYNSLGNFEGYIGSCIDITEKKESQLYLTQSEIIFKNLFQKHKTIMLLIDPSTGNIIDCNNSALNFYGNTYSEMTSLKISDINIPSIKSQSPYHSLILEQVEHRAEFKHIIANGEVRDVEIYSTPIEIGNKVLLFSIVHDITERQKTLLRAKESEERFNLLAENIDQVFWIRVNKQVVYVNSNYEKIFGQTCKSLYESHSSFLKIVHPEDLGRVSKAQAEIAEKKLFNEEYRIIRPDGEIRWIWARSFLVENDGDNDYKVIGIAEDITDRKIIEKELKRQKELFQSIFDNIPVMIALYDKNGIVQVINKAIEKNLGWTIEDIRNNSFVELCYPEDKYRQEVLDFMKNNYYEWRELKVNTKDKRELIISWYNIEFSDGIGINLGQDITERKNSEQQLKDFIEKLKYSEINLKEAKKRAEEASQAKARFLSTMSHEIRTPMNAVIGLTQLLLENDPLPEQLDNLKTLHFSAETLLALINDILDFSKIDAGKIDFEEIEFNLKELINNIKHSLNIKALEKNIVIQTNIDTQIPDRLIGDPSRLSQILNNLIGNAIKFTDLNGQVTVELKQQSRLSDSIYILFSIRDTGIGIAPENLNKIFNYFSQAEPNITRKYGGTGLGLAITKKLIELQGSSIYVDSTEGIGSNFYFELCFPLPIELHLGKSKSKIKTIEHSLVGHRVLLVDDNSVNLLVVQQFLKKWGLKTETAINGIIAVEKVAKSDFDIILMDIQMPIMDGYQATKEIRKIKPSVPIIALTADAELETRNKMFQSGMNDFAIKPFNPVELKNKISKHLFNPSA